MYSKKYSEPLRYHGKDEKNEYFEGWYFKHVSKDLRSIISIIPGISRNLEDTHSFIQTIIQRKVNEDDILNTHYHRYAEKDFEYTEDPFQLKIGNNIFRRDMMELDLYNENYILKGNIYYSEFKDIERSRFSPSAMGFFSYLPFMECYHDTVSMNHSLTGKMYFNDSEIDFTEGKGYVEKDWGTSFPKEYIWLQSNHFQQRSASIMFSMAHIPFMKTAFNGLLCNLYCNEKEYRFATYNNSKVLDILRTENSISIILGKGDLRLYINAEIVSGGDLKAPKNGCMDLIIKEGLSGNVKVKLMKISGEIIFEGYGDPCAVEVVI